MTAIREASDWGNKILADVGFANPAIETDALLSGLLQISPTQLYLDARQELPQEVDELFKGMIHRRAKNEPVAYLLGQKNFFGRNFRVNPSVLVPRPETEILVESVLGEIRESESAQNILDLCTGSGCIGITLAMESKQAAVLATDISKEAIGVASLNAERFGVETKVQFLASDLYGQLGPQFKGYFDIIVSNPPYISSSLLSSLEPDLHFEPRLALDGGDDGLLVLREVIFKAGEFLKPGGLIALEIGFDQGLAVSEFLQNSNFSGIRIIKDLNQHDRIVTGRFRGSI